MSTMQELDTLALTEQTAPTEQPVTLAEAKDHLRITISQDDSYITGLIRVATQRAQQKTKRQFCTATWILNLDEFPDVILVPMPPLSSVTSVKYYDTSGVQQTLTATTDYTVDTASEPGRIQPAYGCVWPIPRSIPNTIEVIFVAGYGAASAVPEEIKHAIKELVAHYYLERSPIVTGTIVTPIPESIDRLLNPFDVGSF